MRFFCKVGSWRWNFLSFVYNKSAISSSAEHRNEVTVQETIDVSCLRKVNPQDLVDVEIASEDWGTVQFPNAPVIDGHFLTDHPRQLLNETSLPFNILMGFNLNEGYFFLIYGSPGFDPRTESNINLQQFRAGLKRAIRSVPDVNSDSAVESLTKTTEFAYTNGIDPNNNNANVTFPVFPLRNNPSPESFYRNLLDAMVHGRRSLLQMSNRRVSWRHCQSPRCWAGLESIFVQLCTPQQSKSVAALDGRYASIRNRICLRSSAEQYAEVQFLWKRLKFVDDDEMGQLC